MPRRKTWKCQRTSNGVKCATINRSIYRKCQSCGKPRPVRKPPAHMAALVDYGYLHYVQINGGEHCGICGRPPSGGRRLDRDHDHKTGTPRGLLCWDCNKRLSTRIANAAWLRAAVAYLERTG